MSEVLDMAEVLNTAMLIPTCASSSPAYLMMFSACKLNKHSDSIQPWHTHFLIWNPSIVPCPVLTVVSWHAHRFLKRQVSWFGIPISLRISQSLLWHTVNKTEVDGFLDLYCFFNDPTDVGNLISISSAFSKILKVHSSHIIETWLGEFWAFLY